MSENQNPQGNQWPQNQQPYGGPQYGQVGTPLPRYDVGSPWKELAGMDFKQTALICLGVSLFCIAFGFILSGAMTQFFGIVAILSNAFLFALLFSKMVPYIKNPTSGLTATIALCVYVVGQILYLFKVASLSVDDLFNVGGFLKFLGIVTFLSYGCVAYALLSCGSKLKHFTLRSVVMLLGIGLTVSSVGGLCLLGSSLSAFGAALFFIMIGGLMVLIAWIMLLVKLVGSTPIRDPYALPGDPVQ